MATRVASTADDPTARAAASSASAAPAAPARRIVIQPGRNSFPEIVSFIVKHCGFELLELTDYDSHVAQTKWTHLRWQMLQSLQLLAALPRLRNSDCIMTIGPVTHGPFLKLLKRLRILRFRQSISIGFFIHSPRFFPLLRLLTKLDRAGDQYIFFSDFEVEFYRTHLGIDPRRMHCLPYSEWEPAPEPAEAELPANLPAGGYYFSGGFSNRDYLPLIEVFRRHTAPLVIIASAINRELDGLDLPPNVTVLRDVPGSSFEAYLKHSKACIVPLKRDTGASGQSVIVRAMRHAKPIVASDFGAVRGYIADGVSGYLLSDFARELPATLARIENDPAQAARLGDAAYRRYCEQFAPGTGAAVLTRILSSLGALPT